MPPCALKAPTPPPPPPQLTLTPRAPTPPAPPTPPHAPQDGWLWKKGEFRHNWTYRFVEIRGPFLYYYKIEKGIGGQKDYGVLKGTIPLIKTTVDSYFHKSRKATFQIKHPEVSYPPTTTNHDQP